MRARIAAAFAVGLAAASAACGETGSVHGRWVNVRDGREWLELRRDSTFLAHTLDADSVPGRFTTAGDTVVLRSSYGHTFRMVMQDDGALLLGERARFRRQ